MLSSSTESYQPVDTRIIQNFHLVWLDGKIDETRDKWRNSIVQLREAVHTVTTFVDVDHCIDFITDSQAATFMIMSEEFSKSVTSIISEVTQVQHVFIFRESSVQRENWLSGCPKVSGIYSDIKSICEELKQAAQDYDHNTLSMNFIKKNEEITEQKSDTLDCSFMYTQMLKKIILTLDFDAEHFKQFISYCRDQFADNPHELRKIDKLEKEYHGQHAIQWYTYQSFLYSMVNRALRMMNVELIVNMGFFIRDLHNHITALHLEKYSGQNHSDSFTVYRGQCLSQTDFNQLKTTEGGLLSFNNFLSTTLNHQVASRFTRHAVRHTELVAVLLTMKINPSSSPTPFAQVTDVSHHRDENEILFSMHSVFRIASVQNIGIENSLWQVNLTLTSDNDPDLQNLMHAMEEHRLQEDGWLRLASLMVDLAQFDRAERLYEKSLYEITDERKRADLYYQQGLIKMHQGEHQKALSYNEKALEIRQKSLPANHPDLAAPYNNIATVYDHMGEYSKALSYYEKVLEIFQKVLPANHPDLATSYNNIATVYDHMGEYSKALSYYEKALEISQKVLPANHPDLATSYNNIATVYDHMGEYSKALSYYEKALEIRQKALPGNHPDLAASYNNIAAVYHHMGEYSKALSYYEKALEIRQKALPENHPDLGTSYNNIAMVYHHMGEYSKALSYYEKALDILQKGLPANHPSMATSYNNIAMVYDHMGEYSKALSYSKKALEIRQKALPANHPDLATSYNNIAGVYRNMDEYSKALSYYDKALEIRQKALPGNHPDLAAPYNNIATVYDHMGEYSKALSYYEKALEIRQKSLPANHPGFAASYNNIAMIYNRKGEYSKALSYNEKALEIRQKALPENHPEFATSYINIGLVYRNMGEYLKASLYFDRALTILEKSPSSDHHLVQAIKEVLGRLK